MGGCSCVVCLSPSTAVGVIYKSFLAVLWDFATVSFSFWPCLACVCVCECVRQTRWHGWLHNAAIRSWKLEAVVEALANAKR